MSGALEKKGFSARDVMYIITIVLAFSANYYTMDDSVGDLETAGMSQNNRVSRLEVKNESYASLPRDVKTMQKDIEANAELTKAIYLGLVAKGIIKPPQ